MKHNYFTHLIIGAMAFLPTLTFAQTNTGYKAASNSVSATVGGTEEWTSPGNALTDNGAYAQSGVSGISLIGGTISGTSKYLKLTGFDFNIPANALINGVSVQIKRKAVASGISLLGANYVRDNTVSLVKDDIVTGNNKKSATNWTATDVTANYGGATDTWGTTLTAADVNGANFGVVLSVDASFAGLASIASLYGQVDAITVQVTYTTTLPVQLSSYNIALGNNAVKLDWQTAAEQDNQSFVIYRKGAVGAFQKIATVAGKNVASSYSFEDKNPLDGVNYYRLAQIDQNGTETILDDAKSIVYELKNSQVFVALDKVFGTANVNFPAGLYNKVVLTAIDGKIIAQSAVNPSDLNKQLNVQGTAPGVYLVRLLGNSGVQSKTVKFIKL